MPTQKTHKLSLKPIGAEVEAPAGTPLRDLLFEQGVEFPCGGNGRCRGCKVRVLSGNAPVNDAQREHLSKAELDAGWRLSCQCRLEDDLTIELRQWDASILANESTFAFTPRPGLGIAVDLGTTTIVAQLMDLTTGHVVAVRTALNPQARHGTDVMSRIQFALEGDGQRQLEELVRHEIGALIGQLLRAAGVGDERLTSVVVVGNTVMHHLFCGIDIHPLAFYPFEPENAGLQTFAAPELGWKLREGVSVRFLPCLGSFVGSDILGGILATGVHESDRLVGLVDLGTNGEIVLGTRDRLLCASTAAGPAFEGARIWMGMRAATGAIWRVTPNSGGLHCEVLGNTAPRGICGSGLVDAVAAGLDVGLIKPTGRLANGTDRMMLAEPVALSQTDVRQLQLAKGAIAAGIRILLEELGAEAGDVTRLYLAGAFGNYVNRQSARRIGLLDFPLERVQPAGNTALLGAKMALFAPEWEQTSYFGLPERVQHRGLNEDPRFQDIYVEEMTFNTSN